MTTAPCTAAVTSAGAAAACLAVAAGAHLAAFPAHRGEGLAVSGFFLAVALLQIAAATILVGRGACPRVRAAIVAGNVGLIALWAWSRVAGVPFGDHAGLAEPVGALDLTAVAAQAVAVGAAWFLPVVHGRARLAGPRLALVALALTVGVGGALLLPEAQAAHGHAPATPSSQPAQPAEGIDPGHQHADPHQHP